MASMFHLFIWSENIIASNISPLSRGENILVSNMHSTLGVKNSIASNIHLLLWGENITVSDYQTFTHPLE